MPGHATAQHVGRIREFGTRHPHRALVDLAVGIDSEPTYFRFEHVGESRCDLIQTIDAKRRIQDKGRVEIHSGETIAAAHVFENRAPHKHVHCVHQVRRGAECVAKRGVGFVERLAADRKRLGERLSHPHVL